MIAMRAFCSFWICCLLVLGLGLSEAPRPCLDGMADVASCGKEACRCDASCTCHLDHASDAANQRLAAQSTCGHMAASELFEHAREARHPNHQARHFAAPLRSWTAILPPEGLVLTLSSPTLPRSEPQALLAIRAGPPAAPPPRSLA